MILYAQHRHSKSHKYARQQTAVIHEFYHEVIDPEMQVLDKFHLNNVSKVHVIDINITFSSATHKLWSVVGQISSTAHQNMRYILEDFFYHCFKDNFFFCDQPERYI